MKTHATNTKVESRAGASRAFTVTIGGKGQVTVPVPLRRLLHLNHGVRVDVYPLNGVSFVALVRHPSRILDFAGDLSDVDPDGRRGAAGE